MTALNWIGIKISLMFFALFLLVIIGPFNLTKYIEIFVDLMFLMFWYLPNRWLAFGLINKAVYLVDISMCWLVFTFDVAGV
jgi:hypothetical protein